MIFDFLMSFSVLNCGSKLVLLFFNLNKKIRNTRRLRLRLNVCGVELVLDQMETNRLRYIFLCCVVRRASLKKKKVFENNLK